jgi:hypothetical protein
MQKLLKHSIYLVLALSLSIAAFPPLMSIAQIMPPGLILPQPIIIGGTVNSSSASAVTVTGSIASGVTATNITYPNDGDAAIYKNTGSASPDASAYRCGTFAQNTGAFATLLQNMPGGTAGDFAHYYCSHNFAINPTTGVISAPDDPTSTSYVEIFGSDAGKQAVFYAPPGATVNLNSTPSYALNLVTGVVAVSGVIPAWQTVATSGVAVNGSSYFVNTSGIPAAISVAMTLPVSTVNATVAFADATGTFATSKLTILAPPGVYINGTSGVPASVTVTTNWANVICTFASNTIGYRCHQN